MNEQPPPIARIVICEDERIVALDLRAFLLRTGYEVPAMYAAAEELLRDAGESRPDLVLMDIHLQGPMDGVEAAAILFERWAIPVILLTAYADGPTIERAKLTHPYAYILKPYDERELKTAISIGLYRASMERRLRRSEERYRRLFEDGLAASILVDPCGAVLESNRAFSRLSSDASVMGDFFEDGADSRAFQESMRTGSPYGPCEVRVKRTDGREAWALLSAAPIELPDGTRAYQCQAVDVTERRTLMDQLVHAQRLSALGRFAGGVAHDFNNVLTAVLGYSRLLRSDLIEAGRGLEELDGIDQAAKRAAALSRQLLMFSRREESRPGFFTLASLARESERMLGRIVGDGAALVVRPSGVEDGVIADRTRLEQALLNLVANARDASPPGGRIVVATGAERTLAETPGAVEPIPAGAWSFLEVCDEGPGIAPEDRARVFQPFFTTKSADRGTGLGLSTVLGIVRQANGFIALRSSPGAGTTMRLLFPAAVATDGPGDTAPAPAPELSPYGSPDDASTIEYPPDQRGKRALVVENDDSVRAIIEALLDRAGYRVSSASQPGEALLMVETSALRPDVLVADSAMPLLSGLELAARLRLTYPALPALLLRSHDASADAADGSDGGAAGERGSAIDAYLDKPFREKELISAVVSLLARGA